MGLTDRQIRRMSEERIVVIDDVNIATKYVSMRDQYGTSLQASMDFSSPVITIPSPGEIWTAERRNTNWYLKHKQSPSTVYLQTSSDTVRVITEEAGTVLEIREDGSIHMKTGSTIQYDL